MPGDILAECGLGSSNRAQKVTLVAALASTAMALTVLLATLCTVCRARRDSGVGPQARYAVLTWRAERFTKLVCPGILPWVRTIFESRPGHEASPWLPCLLSWSWLMTDWISN